MHRAFFRGTSSWDFAAFAYRCFAVGLTFWVGAAAAQPYGFGALPETALPTVAFGMSTAIGKTTLLPSPSSGPLAPSIDWHQLGAVTPVRDQAGCGSCALFSTTAALESHILRTTGVSTDLSEFQFLGCRSNNICASGSRQSDNLSFLASTGLTTETNYPYPISYSSPYPAASCSTSWPASTFPFKATAYQAVAVRGVDDLKVALRDYGPISIQFGVTQSLRAYMNISQAPGAVYSWPGDAAGNGHAVLLVGYDDAKQAFKIKNSWSTATGDSGYLWLHYNTVSGAPALGTWGTGGYAAGAFAVTGSSIPAGYTIGGVSFSDTFRAQIGVTPNSVSTSNAVTVTSSPSQSLPVSVRGGEWSRNCTSSFVAARGTIQSGESVCVRHRTAAGLEKRADTVLTVGDKSLTYLTFTPLAPSSPLPGLSRVAKVVTGGAHTCTLMTNGTVKCWGDNTNKQLGNTGGASATPVDVVGITGATDIAAGGSHTCAVVASGVVKCWGVNTFRQLGVAGGDNPTPQTIVEFSGATAIAAGALSTCVVRGAQRIVTCWGANRFTSSYIASNVNANVAPTDVAGLTGVEKLAASTDHFCAANFAGIACWGKGRFGKVGNGSEANVPTPAFVNGLPFGIVNDLQVGDKHTCAVIGGDVWCWGYNASGQLGNPSINTATISPPSATAIPVRMGVVDIQQLSLGYFSTCMLNNIGSVLCTGDNTWGQQGRGTFSIAREPSTLREAPLDNIQRLSVGPNSTHHCSVTGVGELYCWGNAGNDQTASASESPVISLPVAVAGTAADSRPRAFGFRGRVNIPPNSLQVSQTATIDRINAPAAISVVAGEYSIGCTDTFTSSPSSISNGHNVCVRHTSSSVAGAQTTTLLTVGGYTAGFTTTAARPVSGVTKLFAGSGFAGLCMQKGVTDNYCFGSNPDGGLLQYTRTGDVLFPTALNSLVALSGGASQIAPGGTHRCLINAAGGVACWGLNDRGQLGRGVLDAGGEFMLPVHSSANLSSGVTKIASGAYASCALRSNGSVACWGYLGSGNGQPMPTTIGAGGAYNGGNAIDVAMGYYHVCILSSGGGVSCFGSNSAGSIGNNSANGAFSMTPATPSGLSSGVQQVSLGGNNSCVLKNGGALCWGSNQNGSVGDGTTIDRYVPAQVTGLTQGLSQLASSAFASCAKLGSSGIKCWGTYWSFGTNDFGADTTTIPASVPGVSNNLQTITAGSESFYGLNSAGEIEVWGGVNAVERGNGVQNDGMGWVKVLDGSVASVALSPAIITLTKFPDGSVAQDQAITLTARVLQTGAPTGKMTFYRGVTAIPECIDLDFTTDSQATRWWAVCNVVGFNSGIQTVAARYSGDTLAGPATTGNIPFLATPGLVYCRKSVAAMTEPAILVRYLSGVRGIALLTSLQPAASVSAQSASDIELFLADNLRAYDFDGDGTTSIAVDAVVYTRYALGFRGAALTAGLSLPSGRTTAQVEAALGSCI